ncbi:hypothetical protein KCU67_g2868, partial [Aureobasidium melanogenum]
MPGLLQLPPELLARIVEFVAVSKPAPIDPYGYDDENKYKAVNDPAFSSWNRSYDQFAITPRPDILSLRNLRLASRHFSTMCTTHLYRCVRLLPTKESATRYNNMISSAMLSQHVQKFVFQTRIVPDGSNSCWARQKPGPGDEYRQPHPYFLDALKRVGQFPNLTHVELVFSSSCSGPSWDQEYDCMEMMRFREEILHVFYAGLNHREHPASKVYNLSIKNLQDHTPKALIENADDKDNGFGRDFQHVMSKITHLSLQVATEDDSAAPEHMLEIPESHDFFGHELQTYWLAPIADNLVYLKLYASDMYFGMYPRCKLPSLPRLRTLLLGNISIVNDDQIDWILSHAATLEELVLDDAMIAVGARFLERSVDTDKQCVVYSPLEIKDGRPSYQPKTDRMAPKQKWLWATRWHHVFTRLQQGLPKLKRFAFGHGKWDDHLAFDEADVLMSELIDVRYQYFDEGTGPNNWLEADSSDKAYNDWAEEYGDEVVYQPHCDEEDWQALKDLLQELSRRR